MGHSFVGQVKAAASSILFSKPAKSPKLGAARCMVKLFDIVTYSKVVREFRSGS